MKKYIQITFFLGVFGLLLLIKNLHGEDDTKVVATTPPVITSAPYTSVSPEPNNSIYKDGTFTGSVEDAYYGDIQAQAVIQNGKIANVIFLKSPNDNATSISINSQAIPYLKEETIKAQSASVNIVSGASDSSLAFRKSIATALSAARK